MIFSTFFQQHFFFDTKFDWQNTKITFSAYKMRKRKRNIFYSFYIIL